MSRPQQVIALALVSPQVKFEPALIAVNVLPLGGEAWLLVLLPQQTAAPLLRRPQACALLWPALIAVNVPLAGVLKWMLVPQQATVPLLRRPQLKLEPVVIAVNVPVVGAVARPLVFCPQQEIAPPLLSAQL